jgi:hypothetical protein
MSVFLGAAYTARNAMYRFFAIVDCLSASKGPAENVLKPDSRKNHTDALTRSDHISSCGTVAPMLVESGPLVISHFETIYSNFYQIRRSFYIFLSDLESPRRLSFSVKNG